MAEVTPSPHVSDFTLLRSAHRGRYSRWLIKATLWLSLLIVGAILLSYALHLSQGDDISGERARDALFALQQPWSDSIAQSWDAYNDWLSRHGISVEQSIFDDISGMFLDNLVNSNSARLSADELSWGAKMYIGAHSGAVRVLFVLIVSLRFALAFGVVGLYFGLTSYKPYKGDDALGQMGNGRVFYSGVRASLEKVTSNGAPDTLIKGLACPELSSVKEAHGSPLWETLSRFGATNSTNEALVRVLVKNAATAPYVALAEEEKLLRRAFSGSDLLTNANEILKVALTLHTAYARGEAASAPTAAGVSPESTALSSSQYAERLHRSFERVLTPAARQTLSGLPPTMIATVILAFESGKVLAHSFEGERWVRKSNFPHLSARAVLHSVSAYPNDYSFDERGFIRRGLIFAARKSSFAPVRMPTDLEDESWSLRQWTEILLACPHELEEVTDEVELVGLIREAHAAWREELLERGTLARPAMAADGFATPTNLLFLPVSLLLEILREAVSPERITRLHELLARVTAKQRLKTLHTTEDDSGPLEQLSFDRLPEIPNDEERRVIAERHFLDPKDVSDWLAVRVILSSNGWVASRVGDYSVPSTSIIFAVFKCGTNRQGANALGLLGRPGMVPLRGSKLQERWGANWSTRFASADRATMAETQEDYGKLLQGIEEIDELEVDAANASSTPQV